MTVDTRTELHEFLLAEFLLARIAEDEAMARTAGKPDTSGETLHGYTVSAAEDEGAPDAGVELIARFDPARVLAECEAKRKIVEVHETIAAFYPGCTIETDPCCEVCSGGGEYPGSFPCKTLRLLAAVYADHPDYRDGWRAELAR